MPHQEEVGILVPAELVKGKRVNAFRMVDHPSGEGYFLDYCWLGDDEDCATVVSRLVVSPGFVNAMAAQLSGAGIRDVSELSVRFSDLRG